MCCDERGVGVPGPPRAPVASGARCRGSCKEAGEGLGPTTALGPRLDVASGRHERAAAACRPLSASDESDGANLPGDLSIET